MISTKNMSLIKNKYFLYGIAALSIAGFVGTYQYFTTAMPIIAVDISIDRQTACARAQEIVNQHSNWALKNHSSTASFDHDRNVQNFAELECGGVQSFTEMMAKKLYQPYTWHIRYFCPLNPYELHIQLTPHGQPYSFVLQLPETMELPELSTKQARALALEEATANWSIDFDVYCEIETSQNILPNGRVDHTFVYKRTDATLGTQESDIGQYRLKIIVSGDQVTTLKNYVHIPETFTKRFEAMRCANTTLGMGMQMLMTVLYVFLGYLVSLYFLLKTNRFISYPSLLVATGLATLAALSFINTYPLSLMHYNTIVSFNTHLFSQGLTTLITFISTFLGTSVLLCIAEGLDRWAFGNHVQFLKLFTRPVMRSKEFLEQTFVGYLALGIMFGLMTSLYYFFIHYCQWWAPADTLADPNIIATYIPFLTPFVRALQAGCTEELLFRAIPLSGAMLLGRYCKREKLFLTLGMILQAIIFAGAHVNYPQMPAYFRLIELLPVSLLFGAIYLIFGLYPAMLLHVLYDFILMSMSIFASHTVNSMIQQTIIVSIVLTPLLIAAYYYYRNKKNNNLKNLSAADYNDAWHPTKISAAQQAKINKELDYEVTYVAQNLKPLSKKVIYFWTFVVCIAGSSTIFFLNNDKTHSIKIMLSADEARSCAQEALQDIGVDTQDTAWTVQAKAVAIDPSKINSDTYVWQNNDKQLYESLVGSYLSDTFWAVRYVRFDGTLEQRIEQYVVYINNKKEVVRVFHLIPENASGDVLSMAHARGIALEGMQKLYNLTPDQLKELSAVQHQRPNRSVFVFTFQDMTLALPNAEDQARIIIAVSGSEINDYNRIIFTPETWLRNEASRKTTLNILITCLTILLLLCIGIGQILTFKKKLSSFDMHTFFKWSLIGSIIIFISKLNMLPSFIFDFASTQPFYNQLCIRLALIIMLTIIYQLMVTGIASQFATVIKLAVHKNSRKKIWLQGVALGILITSLFTGIHYYSYYFSPYNGAAKECLNVLCTYVPLLSYVLDKVVILFSITTLGILLVYFISGIKNKIYRYSTFILSLSSILMLTLFSTGIESIFALCIGTLLLLTTIICFIYSTKASSMLVVLPVMSTITCFEICKEIMAQPYPFIALYGVCALIITLVFTHYWFTYLYKKDIKNSQ